MKVNLSDLHRAAERFESFVKAQQQAPAEVVAAERLKLGVRNANVFTAKADVLAYLPLQSELAFRR